MRRCSFRRQGMLGTEAVVAPPAWTPPGAVTWTDVSTASPAAFAEAVVDVPSGAVTPAEASAVAFETFTAAPAAAPPAPTATDVVGVRVSAEVAGSNAVGV